MKKLLMIAAMAALAGCAAPSPQVQAKVSQYQATIPVCDGERDCAAKWDAAQLFVVNHSGYKLQMATNVLLQTYNSVGGSTDLAWKVTKEPMGGGRSRIVAVAYCDNIFGCFPDRLDAVLQFNQAVGSTQP